MATQDAVKESAGHVGVEKYIAEQFGSWASFRPQYMIGSGNNKDCEEWFFDSNNNRQPILGFYFDSLVFSDEATTTVSNCRDRAEPAGADPGERDAADQHRARP